MTSGAAWSVGSAESNDFHSGFFPSQARAARISRVPESRFIDRGRRNRAAPLGLSLIAAAVLASACAAPNAQGTTIVAAGPQNAASDPVLGTVDGESIRQSDLSNSTRRRLIEAENEMQQRHMHQLWLSFEDELSNRLLAREAKRRNTTLEALRKEEIDDKTQAPTDAEVRAIYDRNAADIEVPYEQAAPIISRQMLAQAREETERAYVEKLRVAAKVTTTIPVPSLPRYDIDLGKAPVAGKSDAKVTIVEFSDFQCPYCREAHRVIGELQKLYPDDVRVVYRDFPLPQHPHARPAALAAECANEQEKFWPYHDKLFQDQNALASADLNRYAQEVGLKLDQFQACLADGRAERGVKDDEEAARRLGVQGTPAMFVNGIKLIGLLPLPLMQSLIDHELGR